MESLGDNGPTRVRCEGGRAIVVTLKADDSIREISSTGWSRSAVPTNLRSREVAPERVRAIAAEARRQGVGTGEVVLSINGSPVVLQVVAYARSADEVLVTFAASNAVGNPMRSADFAEQLASVSHLGYGLIDDEGRLEWASDRFLLLIDQAGRNASELRQSTLTEHLSSLVDESQLFESMPSLTGRRDLDGAFKIDLNCRDGRILHFGFDPFMSEHGRDSTLVLVEDVSNVRTAEDELRRLTTRLRTATEGAGIGIWDWDVPNNELWWDETNLRLHGVRPNEFSSNYDAWRARVHPEDLPAAERQLSGCLKTGEPYRTQFRIVLPSGQITHVGAAATVEQDRHGQAVRVVGVNWDITIREEALDESQRLASMLRSAGEIAGVGGWSYCNETDELDWTEVTYVLHDRPPGEPVTLDGAIASYANDEAREEIRTCFEDLLSHGRPFDTELPLRTAQGREIWVRTIGSPIRDRDEITGMNGAIQDVTVQRQARQESETMRVQAEAASRAKSEFLANVSHEMRTPLTAILGFSELMLGDSESDPGYCAQTIRRNGERLLGIINDLLDLSKIEAGQYETNDELFSPRSRVREVLNSLKSDAKKRGLELGLQCGGIVPKQILSDPVCFQQILTNLLNNALKFTESGSVKVHVTSESDTLIVEVVDTGIGMDVETQRRVLEPFQQGDATTSRRFGGTGLGLSIARELADRLGGELRLESEPGKGTRARLTLRRRPGDAWEFDTIAETCHGGPSVCHRPEPVGIDGARVLIVEDGEDNQRLFSAFLKKAGATIEIAENGVVAVDRLTAEPSAFDVVLMDLAMPEMDGEEATKALRLQGFAQPIIALTAHAMEGDRERCLAFGCDDFASKPIRKGALIELVARHFHRAR
ncbi:MAG: PAS domain-containing protein [Planctomycetota bacterium]